MDTVRCYGFAFGRYKGERENRCWWCWSLFFLICYTVGRLAVPTRDVDCKYVGVCSPPARWGSLDFDIGATPPPSSAYSSSYYFFSFAPGVLLLQLVVTVGFNCCEPHREVQLHLGTPGSQPYRQLRMQLIASSGGSWARLGPSTCQKDCQIECPNICQIEQNARIDARKNVRKPVRKNVRIYIYIVIYIYTYTVHICHVYEFYIMCRKLIMSEQCVRVGITRSK